MTAEKDYGWVTDDMFQRKLEELVGNMSGGEILATPGAYEVFSEALNNEVLDALRAERASSSEDADE